MKKNLYIHLASLLTMACDLESKHSVNESKSIKEIINELFANDTSPISSWLINVIETYLQHTQKSEPLTVHKLFTLTNDMLLTYSITTTQTESTQLCSKLFHSLQTNKHLPEIKELYPINTKCTAMYTEDSYSSNSVSFRLIVIKLSFR